MNIQEILNKYSAVRDIYYINSDIDPFFENKKYCQAVMDGCEKGCFPEEWEFMKPAYRYLRSNWKLKIKENCIGFSLSICPEIWYALIHEILLYVNSLCPNFQIEFIGLRNGGCIFNLNNITEEMRNELDLAEYNLWDKKLLR